MSMSSSTKTLKDRWGTRWPKQQVKTALQQAAELLLGEVGGGKRFRKYQKKVILAAFGGRDSLVSATTGAGKTVCFQGLLVLYDLLYNGLIGQRKPESGTCLSLCWILNIRML